MQRVRLRGRLLLMGRCCMSRRRRIVDRRDVSNVMWCREVLVGECGFVNMRYLLS